MKLPAPRLLIIIGLRFGLEEFFLGHERSAAALADIRALLFWRRSPSHAGAPAPRAGSAGPIFIKFGQMLSTRRSGTARHRDELARLQDRVPPFPSAVAVATLEAAYKKPLAEVFAESTPPRSPRPRWRRYISPPADGIAVAVKVLRPGIAPVIGTTYHCCMPPRPGGKLFADGKAAAPRKWSAIRKTPGDELDLMREAANCSQLRRNFRTRPC